MQQHATPERLPYCSYSSAESRHAFRNTILHSGLSSSSTVHQFVFRKGPWARPAFVQPMKYLSRKIFLFDTSLRSFFHFSWSPNSAPSLALLLAIFPRACGGQRALTDGVTLTGVTCDTEWPRGSVSGWEFVLNLAVLLSTMVRHRIHQFYLYFQASNNHLVGCDKSGVGQALSLNLQHGILMTVSNHSLLCYIFPLSVRPFHVSLSLAFFCSLSLLDPYV